MADDSNFDKKPPKKASGSGSDFKLPHKKSKDFQTYFEPKGNAPSGNQEDQYGPKGGKNDHQGSGKPKSYAKNRKESRDQQPNVWKKKHPKVSKDFILEFYAKAPLSKGIDDLVLSTDNLFVNEKLVPVNQGNFTLDPNEGLIPKTAQPSTNSETPAGSLTNLPGPIATTAASTNPPTTSNLSMPSNLPSTADAPTEASQNSSSTTAPSDVTTTESNVIPAAVTAPEFLPTEPGKLTPVQIMREKMRRKNDPNKVEENKRKELDEHAKRKIENLLAEAAKPQEKQQSNEKSIQPQEDTRKPEKENVNTNQAVQEIKKEEFLASLSQEKKPNAEQKEDKNVSPQVRPEIGGVDFSKVSFDNDTKASSLIDTYGLSPEDLYNQQMGRYGGSQENINLSNLSYNPQDPQSVYRAGATQSMPQGGSLYGNKNYVASQVSTQATTPTASAQKQVSQPLGIIFKYFSPNYESKDWYYIDLEEKLQGPYSGRTMDEWFVKGYLPLSLHVTIGQNSGFKKLKDLSDIINSHNETTQQRQVSPKIPSSSAIPDPQYPQQYQNQQQYQQQYQQQQQYPSQYQSQPQYQQQQQQQQYYRQASTGGVHELQRFHSDTPANYQAGASKVDAYYGQQGGSRPYEAQGSHDFMRSASATDIQPQSYYQNYGGGNYHGQDNQPKVTQNYPNYKQAASVSSVNYPQDQVGYQAGFNQTGYNQAQKNTQWKGVPQASATVYPGQTATGYSGQTATGGNFGNQGYGNIQAGQGNMYATQQQMPGFNRTNSMSGYQM